MTSFDRSRAARLAGLTLATMLAAGPALAQARLVTVLPPKRPAALGLDVDVTGSVQLAQADPEQSRATPAASGPAKTAAPAAAAPLSDREIVARANAMLNGLTTLVADFQQTGGDGRRFSGTLYLQRPGKLRFEYDKPSTLEVVSDGSTVLVRDRKLNTADPYPISQTPLKFLLSSKIDLARDVSLQSVQNDPDGPRIALEDTSTLGGTSKITLFFSPDITMLTKWRVIDPQGYTTTVSLSDQERNTTIDPKTFMLNYSRPVE
jgi:outer membrane lipoprotein-sorting protein